MAPAGRPASICTRWTCTTCASSSAGTRSPGPRSLRFLLDAGRPVQVRIEPFGITLDCPRSPHDATAPTREIRIWGRRRLLILERLIPVARSFRVELMGTGMPSFWDCGLRRSDVHAGTVRVDGQRLVVVGELRFCWPPAGTWTRARRRRCSTRSGSGGSRPPTSCRWPPASIGARSRARWSRSRQAGPHDVRSVARRLAEAGAAREPLDLARSAGRTSGEEEAARLALAGGVTVSAQPLPEGRVKLEGRVDRFRASLVLNADLRLIEGHCECSFHFQNKLRKGPCAHLLALGSRTSGDWARGRR